MIITLITIIILALGVIGSIFSYVDELVLQSEICELSGIYWIGNLGFSREREVMSMIHAICDFCGKDCDRTATLLSMTPFQNFARYHTDNEPYGNREKTRSFVICYECCKKHNLPNPYETYSGITKQEGHYEKCLDNYTDVDLEEDKKYDKRFD